MEYANFITRWLHLLFGITWIGMLFYFNFVQGAYFKLATPEALKDAKEKLAPRALWWFRWGALLTFITGLILFAGVGKLKLTNDYIVIGSAMGTLMFINVWAVIWPQQKIALGMVAGDPAIAAAKALRASRTNVLFSAPMLFAMLASSHLGYQADHLLAANGGGTGMMLSLLIIVLLELNGLFGKMGPLASVVGVIHCSLGLTAVLTALLVFL